MSEEEIVRRTSRPNTVDSLKEDLARLGLGPGTVVLVHSSLSSLGWVVGGAVTVVLALEELVRPFGALLMPTHSSDLSDPSGWIDPPVPEGWWQEIRDSMPPYDPHLTPTRKMGTIPECFRRQPGVLRSSHPQLSFAAWGEKGALLVSDHSLDRGLGEQSPLARLYDLDGWVLLLGVGHGNNTSLHLAEHRASYPGKREIPCSSPVVVEGHRRWKSFTDINYDATDFEEIGRHFDSHYKQAVRQGRVGLARAELFPQRLCVDYAVSWMERHRRSEGAWKERIDG